VRHGEPRSNAALADVIAGPSPGGPLRTGVLTVTQSVNASYVARRLDADTGTSGQNGQKVQGFGCAGSSNQGRQWA
jgi:hypothetical protein